MFAGLTKLEALAVAVAFTVRVNLDSIITDLDRAYLPKGSRQPTVDASAARARLMFCLAAAGVTVAPIEAFIVVIISTMIPN